MVENFIENIIKNNKVFVIEFKEEIAISQSLLFKDDAANPVNVVCFWSSRQKAAKCCIDTWQNYKPQEICIATFIEDYLVNVYNESFIAGLDFNEKMEGLEADPLDLILELVKSLKKNKINLEFEYFKNLTDLENQIQKLL